MSSMSRMSVSSISAASVSSISAASASAAKSIFTRELSRGVYQALKDDDVRMTAYLAAIGRACPGKRVLDIGTGPEALLAIAAAKAGALTVVAVEVSDDAAESARKAVAAAGLSDKIAVLAGYSTELELPPCDVVIHEIVGDLSSEEGIAAVLRDLQGRPGVIDATRAGWSVPRRVDTTVAPINLRVPVNASGDGPPEVRLPMVPPAACLLGRRQLLEVIDAEEKEEEEEEEEDAKTTTVDVSAAVAAGGDVSMEVAHAAQASQGTGGVELLQVRTLSWTVGEEDKEEDGGDADQEEHRDGTQEQEKEQEAEAEAEESLQEEQTWTGFICAPRIELDAEAVIDAWTQRTSWRSVLVNLAEPVTVRPGDRLGLKVTADLRAFPVVHTFEATLTAAAKSPEGRGDGSSGPGVVVQPLGTTRVTLEHLLKQQEEAAAAAAVVE